MNSDGKWTPPPEIPGSVRSLKRLLDECRKKNVAMYDVVKRARHISTSDHGAWDSETVPEWLERSLVLLRDDLRSLDKTLGKE
jgi:hypothetical protein